MAMTKLATIEQPESVDDCFNDALGFWKLPETWRLLLAEHNRGSNAAAERYLLEQYRPEDQRRPPAGLQMYYPLKRLLPPGVRHYLHSLLVRSRDRPHFPRWPYETAHLQLMVDWMDAALKKVSAADGWHLGFWPDNHECCVVLTHDVEDLAVSIASRPWPNSRTATDSARPGTCPWPSTQSTGTAWRD
jgi:hypothetical protein